MRIAMIVDGAMRGAAPPEPLDAQARQDHVRGLALSLLEHGHAVRVYATGAGVPDGWGGLDVAAAPRRRSADLLAASKRFGSWLAGQWAGSWRPDVIHAHFYTSGLAALVAAGRSGVPVVETFHTLGSARRRSYERLVGSQASAVLAHSSDQVAELVALKVPRTSISLVPDAIDREVFGIDGPSAPNQSGRARVLSVGPVDDGSGHADAIRALRHVPDVELVVISGAAGPHEDRNVRALAQVAREAGVSDRVRVATAVEADAMPAWYRSAKALICAPTSGPRGRAAIEAMACGVPVIAYDVPVLRDIVVEGVTGELAPMSDHRALGVALRRLLAQDYRQMQYGAAAADRARHCFSWARATEQVMEVYQRLA